jgi:hypothetical protein
MEISLYSKIYGIIEQKNMMLFSDFSHKNVLLKKEQNYFENEI